VPFLNATLLLLSQLLLATWFGPVRRFVLAHPLER
jgi:hypothetical protein